MRFLVYGLAAFGALFVAYILVSAGSYSDTQRPMAQSSQAKLFTPPKLAGDVQPFTHSNVRTAMAGQPFLNKEGQRVTAADFSGKLVLLNLWATWCAPCVKELPALDRLQAKFEGQPFEVVAVSLDRGGFEVADPFLRDKLGLTNLATYTDASSRLGVALKAPGLPVSVLIDTSGQEIGRMLGPAKWDSDEAVNLIQFHLDHG